MALALVGAAVLASCGFSSGTASSNASAAAADTAASPSASADTGACGGASSTFGTYRGQTSQSFCGRASATVEIGSATYPIAGGQCSYDPGVGFAVNIGTMVSSDAGAPGDGSRYFGVVAQPGFKATATGVVGSHVFAVTDGTDGASVEVADGRRGGNVSGKTTAGEPLTASFTC